MKTKINKILAFKSILILILSALFIGLTYSNYKKDIDIAETKKELLEAQKPSELEKAKTRLEKLTNYRLDIIDENANFKLAMEENDKLKEIIEMKIRCERDNLLSSWIINCNTNYTNYSKK